MPIMQLYNVSNFPFSACGSGEFHLELCSPCSSRTAIDVIEWGARNYYCLSLNKRFVVVVVAIWSCGPYPSTGLGGPRDGVKPKPKTKGA